MADDDGIVYADTSALVKLVVHEAETDVLTEQVSGWERVASSEIAAIELPRAVARARHDGRADVADDRMVLEVLAAVELIPLSDDVRALAASAQPPQLRTLDAVHLASALTLGDDLELVVTYERPAAERGRECRRSDRASGMSGASLHPSSNAPGKALPLRHRQVTDSANDLQHLECTR